MHPVCIPHKVTEWTLYSPFVSYRELAFQISEQFEALGSSIGVKCGKATLKNVFRLRNSTINRTIHHNNYWYVKTYASIPKFNC